MRALPPKVEALGLGPVAVLVNCAGSGDWKRVVDTVCEEVQAGACWRLA